MIPRRARPLNETALAAALDRVSAASFAPSELSAAFHDLAVASGAEGCILIQMDAARFGCLGSPGVAETVDAFAKGGWVDRNYRFERGLSMAEKGLLITESMLCTPAELDRAPLQAELLGRMGLRWWAGARIASDGDAAMFLSIERAEHGERFDGAELAALRRALPHLVNAGNGALAVGRAFEHGMMDGLEHVRRAAILLDGFARPVAMNDGAAALFGDLFYLGERRLRAACMASDAALQRAFAAVLTTGSPHSAKPAPIVRLRKREGGEVLARFTIVAGPLAYTVKRPRVLVTLQDEGTAHDAKVVLLRTAYGLTPVEAEVALALGEGHDLERIAAHRRVTVSTLRTHLKAIFLKTDTNRQAELALLISRVVA